MHTGYGHHVGGGLFGLGSSLEDSNQPTITVNDLHIGGARTCNQRDDRIKL